MASSTLFKLKRRLSTSKYAGKLMDEEIQKEFRTTFTRSVQQAYERIVSGWSEESTPRFVARVGKSSAGRYFWNIRVEPVGSLAARRWLMVDSEGRKGGALIKSNKTYTTKDGKVKQSPLRFHEYSPKTLPRTPTEYSTKIRPGGLPRISLGGTGSVGPTFYIGHVKQGNVEPRRFTEKIIQPDAEEEFQKAGRRAYQRVARRFRSG